MRPFESLDLGPDGLEIVSSVVSLGLGRKTTYPIITGLFSFSVSSNGVSGATSGSGVQSSTKSSTS